MTTWNRGAVPIGTRLRTKQRNCLGAVLPLGTTGTVVSIEDGIHTIVWDGWSIRSHWLFTDIEKLSTIIKETSYEH